MRQETTRNYEKVRKRKPCRRPPATLAPPGVARPGFPLTAARQSARRFSTNHPRRGPHSPPLRPRRLRPLRPPVLCPPRPGPVLYPLVQRARQPRPGRGGHKTGGRSGPRFRSRWRRPWPDPFRCPCPRWPPARRWLLRCWSNASGTRRPRRRAKCSPGSCAASWRSCTLRGRPSPRRPRASDRFGRLKPESHLGGPLAYVALINAVFPLLVVVNQGNNNPTGQFFERTPVIVETHKQ